MLRELYRRLKLDQVATVLVDEGRRVRLEVLGRLRDSLRGQLDGIDARIASIGDRRKAGRKNAGGRRSRRAADGEVRLRSSPGGGTSLKQALVAVLRKAGERLHVKDLAKRVKAVGFKTRAKAKNLRVTIYHAMKDTRLFRKAGRGMFALKG